MIKLVILLVVLAVGFGGGVYWSHKNPDAAAKLAAEEERRFIQAQLELNKRLKEKLASLDSKTSAKPGGSSFLSSGQAAAATKEDVSELKAQADKEEQELLKRMEALNAK